MFSKILIANRGEIAVRIIRACKEMGIATVAVYSEADRNALHVALADENICIGPASAKDSYLNEERIISAALATKANAIHPGYGFLSENPHFATLCRDNGIAFIGPTAEQMNRLSDKTGMKRLAEEAGLSTIPGTAPLSSVAEAIKAADRIGYPVMLKARSGGGGRGIRLANNSEELRLSFPNAVAEAEAAFGDGAVYLEKCITPAHHIEVQILADETGNVIALGERDCSIQRHHQKLVEEILISAFFRTFQALLEMEQGVFIVQCIQKVVHSSDIVNHHALAIHLQPVCVVCHCVEKEVHRVRHRLHVVKSPQSCPEPHPHHCLLIFRSGEGGPSEGDGFAALSAVRQAVDDAAYSLPFARLSTFLRIFPAGNYAQEGKCGDDEASVHLSFGLYPGLLFC